MEPSLAAKMQMIDPCGACEKMLSWAGGETPPRTCLEHLALPGHLDGAAGGYSHPEATPTLPDLLWPCSCLGWAPDN